jgi:hypothetical protein
MKCNVFCTRFSVFANYWYWSSFQIPTEVFIILSVSFTGQTGTRKVIFLCFLLGNSPASEVYMSTFRNTLFHLHSHVGVCRIYLPTYLPMKMVQTVCSETSTYKIQTSGIYPKESVQHSENGESLQSRKEMYCLIISIWILNTDCNRPRKLSWIGRVCLFSCRYNPLWLYFHRPVAGFSLLVSEVSWSHTTTRHSR